MTRQRYSIKESLNRILRSFQGNAVPTDEPNTVPGTVLSEDEALSDLAELLDGSLPNETATLPSAITVPVANIPTGSFSAPSHTHDYSASDHTHTSFDSLRIGTAENNITFDTDGTLRLTGTSTAYDDLRVPALSVKVPASGNPGFAQFKDDGAGSQGVFLYWFDPDADEEIYFVGQFPHSMKLDSVIEPHVHWTPASNGTGTVCWGLEYTWIGTTGVFPNTNILYSNTPIPNEDNLIGGRHYMTDFDGVTGTGMGISSMIVCRLFRDAEANGLPDSYDDDVGLLEIDFHYEIDTLGSDTEYEK